MAKTNIRLTLGNSGAARSGKLPKTETLSIRLDPQTRFLADLAARAEDRKIAAYIERAIKSDLSRFKLPNTNSSGAGDKTLSEEADDLWDIDPAIRFANMAFRCPDLLSFAERHLWKEITESKYFWKGYLVPDTKSEWKWDIAQQNLCEDRLTAMWEKLDNWAFGDGDRPNTPDERGPETVPIIFD